MSLESTPAEGARRLPYSSTPKTFYLIFHVLWLVLLCYKINIAIKFLGVELAQQNPELILISQARVSLYLLIYIAVLALVSLVLILQAKRKGWQLALFTLICFSAVLIREFYLQFDYIKELFTYYGFSLVDILFYSISIGDFLIKTIIVPLVLYWLLFYLRNRGVFKVDGR